MEWLLDPNIAYLLVMGALLMAIITIIVPGTGIPEVLLLLFAGASWGALGQHQPNTWALLALLGSLVPFVIAVRRPRVGKWLLLLSLAMLLTGSLFLFSNPGQPMLVHPVLAGLVSIGLACFLYIAATRGMQAQRAHAIIDPNAIVGKHGTARTDVHHSGSVYVAGEQWSARSKAPIKRGAAIMVEGREGFTLIVTQDA